MHTARAHAHTHARAYTHARVRKASTQAQPHVGESTTHMSQVNILICAFLGGVTVMCVKGLSTALILTLKVPHSVQHTCGMHAAQHAALTPCRPLHGLSRVA